MSRRTGFDAALGADEVTARDLRVRLGNRVGLEHRVGVGGAGTVLSEAFDLDRRAVLPQTIESVEVALLVMLDVDDDVGVVEQCPAALAGAFTADRLVSRFAETVFDVLDNRVDLTLVRRRCDDEAVRDDQLFGHIEHHHFGGQLLVGCQARCVPCRWLRCLRSLDVLQFRLQKVLVVLG